MLNFSRQSKKRVCERSWTTKMSFRLSNDKSFPVGNGILNKSRFGRLVSN